MHYNLEFDYKQYTNYDHQDSWVIAQDMEHIAHLHKKTNHVINFERIIFNKEKAVNKLYSFISYNVIRKIFFFFKIKVRGWREIKHESEIIQNENFLFFKVNLVSKTFYDNERKKTCLHDHFNIKIPILLYPFKTLLKLAIIKHIKSQFLEDEVYRKRVKELSDRGIKKKYIFLAGDNE